MPLMLACNALLADVKKCPGWTPVSCGPAPPSTTPYWTHHCLPGTYPVPGKLFRLGCKDKKGPDGFYQCYITMVRHGVSG